MRRKQTRVGAQKIGRCSACTPVYTMQATENGPRVDPPDRGTNGRAGRVEQQAPVWTFGVVIPDELGEHRPQVLLVEDDQVVEALVPEGSDDSLRDRIRTGRPHGAEQGLDAQTSGLPDETPAIDGVPVAQ